MIYLACPYSHPDPAVMQARYEAVNREAARLIDKGEIVFSPISHSHGIKTKREDQDHWYAFDEAFMEHCSHMIVLMLDGWRDSVGVQREIKWFQDRDRTVFFHLPEAVPA